MKILSTRAMTATLAACAMATIPLVSANAQTLKFVSWQVDEAGTGDWWRNAIAKFEAEHPGITIEFTKVDRGAYADTMTTLFAGGQPPHITHLASFEYQNFAENGWMENLDPWLEKDGIDLTGWAGQGTCVWNGETACIMLLYFGFMMAYNPEILAEAGTGCTDRLRRVPRRGACDDQGSQWRRHRRPVRYGPRNQGRRRTVSDGDVELCARRRRLLDRQGRQCHH